jgi:hypothetical protein
MVNLRFVVKHRPLAVLLCGSKGVRAVMSVALLLQLAGCGTAKIPSTQELEPKAFMHAVVDVVRHGDLSDSAYVGQALHIVFTTEGTKNLTTTDGVKVVSQDYRVLFQSKNYSRNSFSYGSGRQEGEKTLRTLFAISLSSTPCITETIVIAAFHSRRTRSSVRDSGYTHSYDRKNNFGAAVTFGSESPCAGMLYMSQFVKS